MSFYDLFTGGCIFLGLATAIEFIATKLGYSFMMPKMGIMPPDMQVSNLKKDIIVAQQDQADLDAGISKLDADAAAKDAEFLARLKKSADDEKRITDLIKTSESGEGSKNLKIEDIERKLEEHGFKTEDF